tara:strand:- start:1429 stop:2460 length:1032 start_codon:yes stop_codon:yes gene_type:complete
MEKVFVSGGSGYIGLHCISKLIQKGYVVKTSLRTISRKNEVIESLNKVVDCSNKLEFCELDLTKDEGWEEEIQGCDYVLHVASPLMLGFPKNPDDIINPAVDGLKRCLEASVKNKVKRFVMTSSFAAIGSGFKNKTDFCDEDWTDLNNPDFDPYQNNIFAYSYSKTLAEKTLWEYMNTLADKDKIEVCTINPTVVIGPSLSNDMGGSNLAIRKLLDGTMPFSAKFGIDLVDVEDVAEMHVEAMINNDANGKRFLLSSQTMWYSKVSEILRANGFKKAPRFSAPNFIIRLFAKFDREVRLILDRLGVKYQLSSNNAKNILKWKPRNVETSIIKTAKQLYDLRKI